MIESFESSGTGLRRWLAAILLGSSVHAGAIGVAFVRPAPEVPSEDTSGPITVELAPLPVAPPSEQRDLPVGPLQNEAQAVPNSPPKTETAAAEEAPPLPNTPYEPDDPDLQFAKHNPETDTKTEPTEDQTAEKLDQPDSVASRSVAETTAPPPIAAASGEQLASPEAGLSEDDKRAIARWQKRVVVHLNKFKKFPLEARRRHIQGEVQLRFRIDRNGRILASSVAGGDHKKLLDDAALQILAICGALPSPPRQISGEAIELTIPIRYKIRP